MFRHTLLGDTIKQEISKACSTKAYKGEEKCVQNFGGEAWSYISGIFLEALRKPRNLSVMIAGTRV
jgi:hypothetical protein